MSRWARRRGGEDLVPENPTALDKAVTDAGALALQAGTAAAVAREEAEIKAQLWNARERPRDEQAARLRILAACKRESFADLASYEFPRGGQRVSGPSVQLAREAARCWGNIRYGLRIVSADEQWIHIKGFAFDLETNAYVDAEDKFRRLVQRKRPEGGTAWVEPDERDLRELVNRRGAICVRNAILQLIPSDIIDEALETADQTLVAAEAGNLKKSREEAVKDMVDAFAELGVTPAMLRAYLGHDLSLVTPEEMAALKKVYASIRDGNTRREDHFDVSGAAAAAPTVQPGGPNPSSKTAQVAAELNAQAAAGRSAEGHNEQGGDDHPSDGAAPARPAEPQPAGAAGEPAPRLRRGAGGTTTKPGNTASADVPRGRAS